MGPTPERITSANDRTHKLYDMTTVNISLMLCVVSVQAALLHRGCSLDLKEVVVSKSVSHSLSCFPPSLPYYLPTEYELNLEMGSASCTARTPRDQSAIASSEAGPGSSASISRVSSPKADYRASNCSTAI